MNMDKYEVGKHLGKGKFGIVHLGRIKETGQLVAIKIIDKAHIARSRLKDQVKSEVTILKLVDHPYIAKYIDYIETDDHYVIITNFTEGTEIYKVLQREKTFPETRVKKYISQLVQAVGYLHQQNIVHRDIKLENIILTLNDDIILVDFGWSVISDSPDTKYNDLVGTLDYLCPEMVKYEYYDSSSDIWAIGVLAYEMVDGKAPFNHGTYKATYDHIRRIQYNISLSYSDEFRDFIQKIFQRQNNRITIEEMKSHPFLL